MVPCPLMGLTLRDWLSRSLLVTIMNQLPHHVSKHHHLPPGIIILLPAASSLIRGMLTPKAEERASIVDICSHWWINQGYDQSCLEEAEYLASLTPVRLDLLLSLTKTEHKGPVENEKHEVMNDFQFCSTINHDDDYIAGG